MKAKIATIFALILVPFILYCFQYTDLNVDSSKTQIFNHWKKQYSMEFSSFEETYRFKIFLTNLQKIEDHNSKLGKTYQMGINQFAALTEQQFAATYLMHIEPHQTQIQQINDNTPNGPTVDWVSYGAVSPVKNQGSCQATYAYSAIGAIEGTSAIIYKSQTQYSVQQLIDCSKPYGNSGCATGNMENCFKYIQAVGILTRAAYPEVGYQKACTAYNGTYFIKGYLNVRSGDCTGLANALINEPISVAVDGSNFQFYKSGVFTNCKTSLSLAVLLVGMTDSFWTLKNSWGTAWGQSGYIRIGRGNTCGVCAAASYPLAK